MEGIIFKALSGFYYVKTNKSQTLECRARGRLKKDNIKPVVGDRVVVQEISQSTGVIEEVIPRKNYLVRPSVANIDQLMLVFAAVSPNPDYLLMDRLTVIAQKNGLDVLICISKIDLDQDTLNMVKKRFKASGFPVIGISNKNKYGFDDLKDNLKNKISTLSGPSGVGKSTMINTLNSNFKLAVSSVSEKTKRGKHTTTYCELLEVIEGSFVVDTPGFTSLELTGFSIFELTDYFPEFQLFNSCRYTSCIHENEEQCGVKDAVREGKVDKERYKNYLALLKEIREKEVKY